MTSIRILDTLVQGGSQSGWKLDSIHRDGDEAYAIMIIGDKPFLITVEPMEEGDLR